MCGPDASAGPVNHLRERTLGSTGRETLRRKPFSSKTLTALCARVTERAVVQIHRESRLLPGAENPCVCLVADVLFVYLCLRDAQMGNT